MSSMLRQHHVKIQDLAKFLRGYDPAKPQTAEEWSKVESAGFEPGMLLFCLERVSAPSGLAFGKKDESGETYRVKDLCVVVGRDNNRPLVVNITASAFELRFLEVLMLEKARKAILDGKDFLYVAVRPAMRLPDAKVREIEQLGAVYAQGGSRRTLVVDTSGPQEPAVALLGSLGVKLAVGGIGKQVLDIGSICHMLFTPEGRHEDPNKAIVKQAFAPIPNTEHITPSTTSPPQGHPSSIPLPNQGQEPIWQEPISSHASMPMHAADLYSTPPSPQDWQGDSGWATPEAPPAPPTAQADKTPKPPDLRFSFERTETSTDPSSWYPPGSAPAAAAAATATATAPADYQSQAQAAASQFTVGSFPIPSLSPGNPFEQQPFAQAETAPQAPQYALPDIPPPVPFEQAPPTPQYALPDIAPPTPFEQAPPTPQYALPDIPAPTPFEQQAPQYALPDMPPPSPFEGAPPAPYAVPGALPSIPFATAPAPAEPPPPPESGAKLPPPPIPFATTPSIDFSQSSPAPDLSGDGGEQSSTGGISQPPKNATARELFSQLDSLEESAAQANPQAGEAGAPPAGTETGPLPTFNWEAATQTPEQTPGFNWAPSTATDPPKPEDAFSWKETKEFNWTPEAASTPAKPEPPAEAAAASPAFDVTSASAPPEGFRWAPEEAEPPSAPTPSWGGDAAPTTPSWGGEPGPSWGSDAPSWAQATPADTPKPETSEFAWANEANNVAPPPEETAPATPAPDSTPPAAEVTAPPVEPPPAAPVVETPDVEPQFKPVTDAEMPDDDEFNWSSGPEDDVKEPELAWAPPPEETTAAEAGAEPTGEEAKPASEGPSLFERLNMQLSKGQIDATSMPEEAAAETPEVAKAEPVEEVKVEPPAKEEAPSAKEESPAAVEEDKEAEKAEPSKPQRERPGRKPLPISSESPFADIKKLNLSEPAKSGASSEEKQEEPVEAGGDDKYKHLAEAISGLADETAADSSTSSSSTSTPPTAPAAVPAQDTTDSTKPEPAAAKEEEEEAAPTKTKGESSRKAASFQEPRLVMNEMAMLMSKLEQQVAKAAKKLNGRSEEIKQRLNKQMDSLVEQASETEKQSQTSTSTLSAKMTKKLDDVSEEVRLKVSDVAANGRYTIKHLLTTHQTQVEETKTSLYDSVREVCKNFKADTETLTKASETDLRKLIKDRVDGLGALSKEVCARLKETNTQYADKLEARFQRFEERMAEETDSVTQSLERNVRSMTEEIEGSWDRASDKLQTSKLEFEQTISHTVRTAQLNISQNTRRLLTEHIMPRLRERKMILRTMSQEMSSKFLQESDSQVSGQLLGLEASLGAARQQLQSLVEECMSSIDTVGRGQQAGLEEIFKETSTHAERATLEVQTLLNKTETQIDETESTCKKLAETSSLDNDPDLTEERSTATARVQQVKQQANSELQTTIESCCDRLEQISQATQKDLTQVRVDQTQSVRDAAENGLATIRDAIQEAFTAIQAAREKYME